MIQFLSLPPELNSKQSCIRRAEPHMFAASITASTWSSIPRCSNSTWSKMKAAQLPVRKRTPEACCRPVHKPLQMAKLSDWDINPNGSYDQTFCLGNLHLWALEVLESGAWSRHVKSQEVLKRFRAQRQARFSSRKSDVSKHLPLPLQALQAASKTKVRESKRGLCACFSSQTSLRCQQT